MKRAIFIFILMAVIAALIYAMILSIPKQYVWDMSAKDKDASTEPYGLALFDQVMMRSLPNRYSTHTIDPAVFEKNETVKEQISNKKANDGDSDDYHYAVNAPSDGFVSDHSCNILIIQTHTWTATSDGGYYTVFPALFDIARRGGKAMYVLQHGDIYAGLRNALRVICDYYTVNLCLYDDYPLSYKDKPYSKPWLEDYNDRPITVRTPHGTLELRSRYALNYINSSSKIINNDMLGLTLNAYMYDSYNSDDVYVADIHFPESDGHLYISTLGLYFSNIGLKIPQGDKVIEELMGLIDDREVKRIQYPVISATSAHGHRKGEDNSLDVLARNDSLAWVWMMAIIFTILLLIRGLMRRQPPTNDGVYLDKTDFVAVREYQFRKSPLLHFIFQCSWLYKDNSRYNQLFDSNFRRVAKAFSHTAGYELLSASDDQLISASHIFASLQKRNYIDIHDELKWIRDTKRQIDNAPPDSIRINSRTFARSQIIAEHFPL